ncbi:hypothetical protein ISO55_04200 [Morganella morganii subsp. morganii]|uniref:hypothetical protein n=1 Tax=Morganella morganii TaxID=582 RepID=UPI001BD94F8D|nr:hypothetical protein [Morganella morganii]MBT0366177.1 hypothetical protein [Morganella morganii subsp. morganii]
MKKIGDVTSTADKNGEWTNGNVAAGIAPTILEAGWLNSVQREILGVIIAAGMQQDKNDDTQLSKAISKIISGGDYATKTEVNSKLAKDQNGADIPNKDTFIKNLGLGEIYATREDVGQKLDKSKVTNSLINSRELVPTTALLIDNLNLKQEKGDYATVDELKKITLPKGMVSFFLHRENSLPAGWYSLNGDRYSADSFPGKALRSLPEEIKSDWNIIDSGSTITTPNLRQPDGRLPFIRPSNGKGSSPGIVTGDTIRDITGEFGYESQYGLTSSDSDVSGAFYAYGPSRKSLMGGGTGQTTNIAFKASKVVPTGTENKPLSIDMIAAVYLGVA